MKNLAKVYDVVLSMIDELTGEPVERIISKVNAMSSSENGYYFGTEEQQRAALERWIAERGNEQHGTTLKLESWKFI